MPLTRSAIPRVVRLLKNSYLDLRFGGFLGGTVRSPYGHLGIDDTANTDYAVLPRIFDHRIKESDVLVDIGCGKGRVINWWLSRGLRNKMVGIELHEQVAMHTRNRLRGYPNVTVITGDALQLLPEEGTIFYMFNPFSSPWVRALKGMLLARLSGSENLTLLYYNPVHLDIFKSDPKWLVMELDLHALSSYWHDLAVVRRRG